MGRISKENYYLDIAETVLRRATCLRRVYGAIIVKNDEIISTGYNGAPRGRQNCVDNNTCLAIGHYLIKDIVSPNLTGNCLGSFSFNLLYFATKRSYTAFSGLPIF